MIIASHLGAKEQIKDSINEIVENCEKIYKLKKDILGASIEIKKDYKETAYNLVLRNGYLKIKVRKNGSGTSFRLNRQISNFEGKHIRFKDYSGTIREGLEQVKYSTYTENKQQKSPKLKIDDTINSQLIIFLRKYSKLCKTIKTFI